MSKHSTNPPGAVGLYDPRFEHDACGLAALVRLDGAAGHDLVEQALRALENLDHRGATGADPETGDGAGIMTQLPHRFLRAAFRAALGHELPPPGSYATGLVFLPRNESAEALVAELVTLVKNASASPMLTSGICKSYKSGIASRGANTRVEVLAQPAMTEGAGPVHVSPVLFQVSAADLIKDPSLEHEIFGPTTLIIRYSDSNELATLARQLEGQLTATLQGTEADILAFSELVSVLENKAGRLLVNGFPTGVEVCHAMVHGGPYPATSDSRHTSVGTQAIYRFVRPVCYQDFPQVALPAELKDENPLGILRLVDGTYTRDAVREAVGTRA